MTFIKSAWKREDFCWCDWHVSTQCPLLTPLQAAYPMHSASDLLIPLAARKTTDPPPGKRWNPRWPGPPGALLGAALCSAHACLPMCIPTTSSARGNTRDSALPGTVRNSPVWIVQRRSWTNELLGAEIITFIMEAVFLSDMKITRFRTFLSISALERFVMGTIGPRKDFRHW